MGPACGWNAWRDETHQCGNPPARSAPSSEFPPETQSANRQVAIVGRCPARARPSNRSVTSDAAAAPRLQARSRTRRPGTPAPVVRRFRPPASGCGFTSRHQASAGYPGARFHGGGRNVDTVEQAAIDRATELFDCAYANVQPHSGSQANLAVF